MGLLLGTYLPRPVTKKHSTDEEDDKMVYGVSSMQGWRETQEDAHNCILNYDPGISFFAVYDGHGGNEVSEYTSQYLPDYLKKNRYYILGNYENALKDSFVRFDCSLKKPRVVKLLRKLIKDTRRFAQNMSDPEDDEENITSLKKEALMPLEQVLTRYALSQKINKKLKASKVKEESDLASPSSSKETVRCSEVSSNDVVPECSSSKSNTVSLSESESEVSSSSSIAQKKSLSENNNKNKENVDKTLDSTSNGSEANNSGSSENVSETVILSSESIKSEGDAQPESSKASNSEKPADSATCSKSIKKEDVNVKCNGESVDIQSDEVISSSVENGELDVPKSSGKGKSLVKYQPKKAGKGKEKESGSDKNLFQEFLSTVLKDDSSESDSDDATFTEPESRSDDEDEEEDDDEEEEEVEEEEEEEEEEDDEEEDEGEVEGDDKQEDVEEVSNENTDENLEQYEDSESEGNEDNDENEMDEDKHFLTPGCDSGCTALVALVIDNKLYVANAGDCRCVVSKNGEAIEMSFDHKPENEIELKRIRRAGGRVHGGRVNDGLNLSRAFGDHIYKRTAGLRPEQQMISPLPDIQTLDLDPDIEFMVLACDGIWNSMSSQEVVDFVRPKLQTRTGPVSKICEQLFDHCLAPDTLCDGTGCDNMTAIIVQFKNSRFFSLKKRPIEENEAEEAVKKLKTEDVTSTGSIDSSQPGESFLEKPSNSPDTTQ